MTAEEKAKEAADKAAVEQAAKDAEAETARLAKEAANKAAADAKAAKAKPKKTFDELKSTDTIVVEFRPPTAKEEDGENVVGTASTKQHVKKLFWMNLAKNKKGFPLHSPMKGAKLLGYVEDGKEINFK